MTSLCHLSLCHFIAALCDQFRFCTSISRSFCCSSRSRSVDSRASRASSFDNVKHRSRSPRSQIRHPPPINIVIIITDFIIVVHLSICVSPRPFPRRPSFFPFAFSFAFRPSDFRRRRIAFSAAASCYALLDRGKPAQCVCVAAAASSEASMAPSA